MHRFFFFVVLRLSVCAHCLCAQRALPFDTKDAWKLVEAYLHRNSVPGAVVVVTDGNEILYEAGFGRDSENRPLTAHSPMPVASLSKSMTAMAVMQLVDQNRIDLDQAVVHYLPEFRLADGRFRRITVRQLLMHTSGMADSTFREKSIDPVPADLESAVASMRDAGLRADPGTRRSYHNPNYWVAARLVEVVSGQPFSEYLQQHVFQPANMTESTETDSLRSSALVGKGHIRVLGVAMPKQEPAWFLGGCCGVVSTAHDLDRWLIAQNSPARPLTSEASLQALHQGMGWNRTDEGGHPVISHNGVMFTYSAQQYLLPDARRKIGIAVVANAGLGLSPLPAEEIAQILRGVIEGRQPEPAMPFELIVDVLLLMLTLVTVGFVCWRVMHPVLVSRRGKIVSVVRAACLLALLLCFPACMRLLSARDVNAEQTLVTAPLLLLWLAAAAIGSCVLALHQYRRDAALRTA